VVAERKQREEEAERKRQAEVERQRLAAVNSRKQATNFTSPAQLDQDDLSSERFGANYYAKLRDLLAAQDWKAADQETLVRWCEVMDRQSPGGLRIWHIEKFPCLDLRNIDHLWVKYSNGKFGFSVQKEIWQSCVSPADMAQFEAFGDRVGWRKDGNWVSYDSLVADSSLSSAGEFPAVLAGGGWFWGVRYFFWGGVLFSRVKTCKL
jgi:hypothetical protein